MMQLEILDYSTEGDMNEELKNAQEAIEKDMLQRSQQCGKELAELMKKHNCDLVAVPQLTPDGRTVAYVQIVAR